MATAPRSGLGAQLSAKWHGAPVYVWAGGVAIGVVLFIRWRASKSAAASSAQTATTAPLVNPGLGSDFGSGSGSGSSGDTGAGSSSGSTGGGFPTTTPTSTGGGAPVGATPAALGPIPGLVPVTGTDIFGPIGGSGAKDFPAAFAAYMKAAAQSPIGAAFSFQPSANSASFQPAPATVDANPTGGLLLYQASDGLVTQTADTPENRAFIAKNGGVLISSMPTPGYGPGGTSSAVGAVGNSTSYGRAVVRR